VIPILIVLAVFLAPAVLAWWVERDDPQRYLRVSDSWCQTWRERSTR
jgi:hypothetical protein